jgi:Abnormal spindle-like microcephaly-assoc'd, ASPM-SPD-2-Hydin
MPNPEYGVSTMLDTGVVSFSPTTAPLVFPVQLINTISAPQTVRLTNNGVTALSVTSVKVSGAFRGSNTCGASVPAGVNCEITVKFEPKAAGTFTGLVTLTDSASSKPQFIDLTGGATVLKVLPASLNFGSQKVGTRSAPQSVTATNEGSKAIQISSVTIGGAGRKDFSETDSCTGRIIEPAAHCSATVTFDPTKTGARSAGLYFNLPTGSISPTPADLAGTGN